tara:strand:- start:2593 stop:3384 length:792 start_codon:yes stop_codon:yes gene_type:complete
MSAQHAFNSKYNKGLLWNTLNESGCFQGIQNSDYSTVKEHFEQSIMSSANKKSSVLDLNKQFIAYFSNYLQQFKNKTVQPPAELQQIYSSDARRKANQDQFNYALNTKQNERVSNEPQKPTNINFSSNTQEDKPIKDMDAQLAKMMADRKLDINVNNNDKKKAESWINNGQDRNLSSSKKSVTFSDKKPDKNDPIEARMSMNNDFLSKLKTVDDNPPTIPIPSMDSNDNLTSLVQNSDFSTLILQKIQIIESELANIKELLKK